MQAGKFRSLGVSLAFSLLIGSLSLVHAQVSGPPSAVCHVTDGSFTSCAGNKEEWSDVTPVAFPASDSYLYVNQDAGHQFLYLMYDFPIRTTAIAATDAVHVNFYTVEQEAGSPILITYDVYIQGNGQTQILQQGKPTPPGRILSAVGFHASPNSATPHLMAELQVPLSAGPPSTYSDDPLYWSATIPSTPPPPPCPTQPGKSFNDCVKKYASAGGTVLTLGGIAAGTAGGLCTAGTIGACAPAEVPLIIGGAISAALGYLVDKYIAGDPPGIIYTIPPDPNYTTIATPATYTLSVPMTGVPGNIQTALNALFSNEEQAIAVAQAGITSIARAEGAAAAGAPTWVTTQTQQAQAYGAQLGTLVAALPTLEAAVQAAFKADGIEGTFNVTDVSKFLAAVPPTAPASELKTEIQLGLTTLTSQLGFSAADKADVIQLLELSDAKSAASLGTGAFPAALTDPAFNTALVALGTGAVENAPSLTALNTHYQATLPGDYIAAGIGLRGQTSGNIALTGVPAGATIVKAFLYFAYLDNGEDASLHSITMNGNALDGSLIGSGPDTCWGDVNSFTYRADVSSLVTGNGTYALTNVASGGAILAEGASLVVVYQLAGKPVKTIIVDDGSISMPNGVSAASASFGSFTASNPLTATTTFIVGDGQGAQFGPTNVTFTGTLGTLNIPNLFDANDGPLWDTDLVNVSSVVGAGSDTGSANISITGDCLLWSAQAFSVTTSAVTTPVVATAGVVEAGTNGDTVVNLRGLGKGDGPTITDQILAIVQFRIIQNPTLSGPALTTQLVSGLVNDGVIPASEAAAIEAAVNAATVTPPAPVATKTTTTTTVTLLPNANLVMGEALTLTVVVKATSGTAIPAGTVTFSSPNSKDTDTVTLDKTGMAVVHTFVPVAGNYSLIATYNGNATFISSVSPTLSRTVAKN